MLRSSPPVAVGEVDGVADLRWLADMAGVIGHVTYLVRDYDEGIAYFTGKLGFKLVEDTRLSAEKRWVLVAPGGGGTSLLLAKASAPAQVASVGNQAGGRVFLFLHTDDFERDHAAMTARGMKFIEPPRHEAYGTVAVFEDLYGNKWDLVEKARPDDDDAAAPREA
jgi:catechol 2,3-dioxygenase-like lactoylglutathione lyase family enzyme